MLARLYSVTLVGIDDVICEVEVDVARGGFEKSLIVGLPDAAVKESTERVKSAIINCGYKYLTSECTNGLISGYTVATDTFLALLIKTFVPFSRLLSAARILKAHQAANGRPFHLLPIMWESYLSLSVPKSSNRNKKGCWRSSYSMKIR